MSVLNLVISIIIGGISAAVFLGFNYSVAYFETLRQQYSWIVLCLPIALIVTYYLKSQTLYYPRKISDLEEAASEELSLWNRKMSLYHYLGALLSHLFGASVGREGVIVLVTSGLAPLLNLNIQYWIPIAASIGFAVVTGYKWIGLVFLVDLFTTQMSQKILVVIGSWVGVLILETMQVEHLLRVDQFQDASTFFNRVIFIFTLAVICGSLAKVYKKAYFFLSYHLQKKMILSCVIAAAIGFILWRPELTGLQSLSLGLLQYFKNYNGFSSFDVFLIALKLILTVVCVAIGFFGGEFVPLVVCGVGIGTLLAQYFGMPYWIGLSCGAYLLLAGVTQLKWTFLFMALILSGWQYVILYYFAFSICCQIAGEDSLYFTTQRVRKNIFNSRVVIF